MRLARVLGPVWGARKAAGLDGQKLLEVAVLGRRSGAGDELGECGRAVAVDQLGAGPGELVLIAHGSRVRDLTVGETVCDKDVVVAIVDSTEITVRERA